MEKKLGVSIDSRKCNGDGICVEVCPMNHLECKQVEWIAINSKKEVHRVAGTAIDSFRNMIQNNHPLAGRHAFTRIVQAWDSGMDMVLRDTPALVMAHVPSDYPIGTVDCAIAFTYLDVAAPSLDLGTCWAGIMMIALAQSRELSRKLNIPDTHECRGVMMLGYSQYRYSRIVPRKKARILWM
jgi:NAD-dependent dihydropyrimidine dehydrogenase PreA subunit